MKKILISLVIVSLIVLATYLFLGRLSSKDPQTPDTYIEFSPLYPDSTSSSTEKTDIRNILKDDISPELEKVINLIYVNNYHVFECSEEVGGGQVLIMTAQYDGSVARDGYDGAYQAIKKWESSAVSEIGHIVFPSLADQTKSVSFTLFEPYQVNNPHILASRDFHKTLFYIGETPYEMHYGWILNYVIFAPSRECLEATMIALYHDH